MISKENLGIIVNESNLICCLCGLLESSMLETDLSTTGDETWWDDLVEHNGWKVKRNRLSGYYKILDPNNYKKAWGTEESMKNALKMVLEMQQNNSINDSENTKDALYNLGKLGELKDKGFIFEEEFIDKKNKILSQI